MSTLSAGVILIGNEILSGRVQDANLAHLAKELSARGIPVLECRAIPDDTDTIVDAVNTFRKKYTYVFTTGGIGPTHDDITTAAVAKAFGVPIYRDEKIVQRFKEHYGDRATAATYTMCDFPTGAEMVENAATVAPGFRMENVYVLAGIPNIMRAMFETILPTLAMGEPILEISYTAHTSEGKISFGLGAIQDEFPDVSLGSYPFQRDGRPTVSLVARSKDAQQLQQVSHRLAELLQEVDGEVLETPSFDWPQQDAV